MSHTQYLIVGGSAAGMSAAEKISQLESSPSVRVISEEPDTPYFRPMIPFVISRKKSASQISLLGQGPYRSAHIDFHLKSRADTINPEKRTITTENGTSYSYDKLLIATGSSPIIPDTIQGTETKGVFALRTLDDSQKAASRASDTKKAVMLGGGLLNLKTAFALLERKIQVTLVVYSPEILSQLMEPEDASLIRNALDNAGLEILTGVNATDIIAGDNGVQGVHLDDGRELECQMVCIGKGVQPNIQWLNNSGILLQKGVVVNKHTESSIKNIYAAGDVAVTFDPITGNPIITGLWTNAVEMGKCAGANMAGQSTVHGGTFGILNATQVANMPFVSMGIVHTAGTDFEVVTRKTSSSHRKLVFSEDGKKLIGAIFIGDIRNCGLYKSIIKNRTPVNEIKKNLINHRLHYGHFMRLQSDAPPIE